MRQLYPTPLAAIDPAEAYGRLKRIGRDRPAVRANMISSADGAASVDGRSGGLGGADDRSLLLTLRSLADVILVGAATVRSESYGPVRLDEAARTWRLRHGLTELPPIAVLTRSCRLDWSSALFATTSGAQVQRTLVITIKSADPQDRARAGDVAEVLVAGDAEVSMAAALAELGRKGFENVLSEGGPSVVAQMASAGVLDELCLTIAPRLALGAASRITAVRHGDAPSAQVLPLVPLELRHVLEGEGGYLFLRYGLG